MIFENCAGGGGRTDIGMVRRFSHTWVTDWQIAPRSFTITNGMTMALPPEYVDRLIGGQSAYTKAEFAFQSRLLLFVRPDHRLPPKPLGAPWNPHLLASLRHLVELYKGFVRPIMATGRIYHPHAGAARPGPAGLGCPRTGLPGPPRARSAACSSSRRRRGRSTSCDCAAWTRGDATASSSTTPGRSCELEGAVLMNQGLTIRLPGALTSELLLLEAL